MSYPRDLDDYSDEELLAELANREAYRAEGRCDYCRRGAEESPCRHPERHTLKAGYTQPHGETDHRVAAAERASKMAERHLNHAIATVFPKGSTAGWRSAQGKEHVGTVIHADSIRIRCLNLNTGKTVDVRLWQGPHPVILAEEGEATE